MSGQSSSGTDQKGDGQNLVDGLREIAAERPPDDAYWCPNCEEYSVTEVLQTVQRPKFGKENELWGCTECRYCFLPATEWRSIDTGTHQDGDSA